MSHNERFYRPSILSPMWVPSPYQIRNLDQQTSESVDGDHGGLWNPFSQIAIGGAGVNLSTAGGFTGGVTTKKYASGGALRLGNNDYPVHVTPKTRKIYFPIRDTFYSGLDVNVAPSGGSYDQSIPGVFQHTATPQFLITSMALLTRFFPIGVTISEVRLRFKVGTKPASVPASLPSFIFATQSTSEQKFLPTPGTVAAYYNAGLPQDIVLVPATLTTVTNADYFFQLSDNSGTLNTYISLSVTISNIVNMLPGL